MVVFTSSLTRKKYQSLYSGGAGGRDAGIAPSQSQSLTFPETTQFVGLASAADSSAGVEMQDEASKLPEGGVRCILGGRLFAFPQVADAGKGLCLSGKMATAIWGGGEVNELRSPTCHHSTTSSSQYLPSQNLLRGLQFALPSLHQSLGEWLQTKILCVFFFFMLFF